MGSVTNQYTHITPTCLLHEIIMIKTQFQYFLSQFQYFYYKKSSCRWRGIPMHTLACCAQLHTPVVIGVAKGGGGHKGATQLLLIGEFKKGGKGLV